MKKKRGERRLNKPTHSHSVQVRAKKVLAAESDRESLTEGDMGRLSQGAQQVTMQLTTLVTTVKAMITCNTRTYIHTHIII